MLDNIDIGRTLFVEGESARIGRLAVPLPLVEHMRAAPCIEIAATPQARLAYLLQDYAYLGQDAAGLADKLGFLKQQQGTATVLRWQQWAQEGNLPSLFAELMTLHYDPHYQQSQSRHFSSWPQRRQIAADDLSAKGIAAVADAILGTP